MGMTLKNLFTVFVAPREAFVNLKVRPRWFMAFFMIALVLLGIAWLTQPFSEQLAYRLLSEKFAEQQVQQMLASAQRFQYVGLILAPFLLLLRWLIISAFLYFASELLGAPNTTEFKTVYAVTVYSEIILVLMGVINLLLLYNKGIDVVQNVADLQAVVGLDILFADTAKNLSLFTFFNNINIFSIWYVVVLTIGISVVTNFSKLKSGILVTTIWLLGVGFQVAIATISNNSAI
jgi:hypothetical protein